MNEIVKIIILIIGIPVVFLVSLILLNVFLSDRRWKNASNEGDDKHRDQNLNALSGKMGFQNKTKGGD